jgi:hypothetical protein
MLHDKESDPYVTAEKMLFRMPAIRKDKRLNRPSVLKADDAADVESDNKDDKTHMTIRCMRVWVKTYLKEQPEHGPRLDAVIFTAPPDTESADV